MDISLWLALFTALLLIAGPSTLWLLAHPVGQGRQPTASLRRAGA